MDKVGHGWDEDKGKITLVGTGLCDSVDGRKTRLGNRSATATVMEFSCSFTDLCCPRTLPDLSTIPVHLKS